MNLLLEIEFLTGVCRAAQGPGINSPDWPPQPDRVFSALASAWGVRGELDSERKALEWLEQQPPPDICASGYTKRTAPDVYVPPNGPWAKKYRLHVLPELRKPKARRFPVARLDDPNAVLIWREVPDAEVFAALNALASCVGYVGHSASLTRCRFHAGEPKKSDFKPMSARRTVYRGRLLELEEAHRLRPARPLISSGAPVLSSYASSSQPSSEWLVLKTVGGNVPDIRASALVCRLLRQALMAGYRRTGQEREIPEIVSGHAPDGKPTRTSHLSIVPLAFVGSPHADGRVFGFAVVPPRDNALHRINGFRAAFESVAPFHEDVQRRVLILRGSPLRKALELSPATLRGDSKKSLRPEPYLKQSKRWATVTPIVLDRHLKRNDDAEIRELVALSCKRAGLPRPGRIQVAKHSAVQGTPPARPLVGEPPWARWKLPETLASRQLTHAVMEFQQAIDGPVLLGAGRYTGLGFCRRTGY